MCFYWSLALALLSFNCQRIDSVWKKVKIRKIVEKLKTEACICSMDSNHCILRGHNLPTALGATPDCC